MSSGRLPWRRREGQHSFLADLRAVLAERNFRRLFATRLISQTGDGMFAAGLGAYVFFNATSFPNPGAAAAAFTVLYLPYSLVGPFAGVFIDRWSRRQILVWSAVLRAAFVALTAYLVASGRLGVPLYISVLAVLGVNRFFLSSLSAALPHVVGEDTLVMANSVAPTAGTIVRERLDTRAVPPLDRYASDRVRTMLKGPRRFYRRRLECVKKASDLVVCESPSLVIYQ